MIIPGYPEGSDITFMNSIYTYPKKVEVNGKTKWSNDTLTIIYRDNALGKKKHITIESPEYTYYMVDNPKDSKDYNRLFIEKEKVKPVTCRYNEIERDIAERTGYLEEFKENIRMGARSENRKVHMNPDIFCSDMNIEDYYRLKFGEEYTNNIHKIHKAYFDIEVDGKYQAGDFPELGECPINAASYLDEKENKVYTFILRNNENPLIEEFEKSLCSELYKELYDFIVKAVGGWKKAHKFGIENISQEFLFFDDEISMIAYMFKHFHNLDPDFILAWNMAFDIPYVIERIKELGYEPEDIMCNKEFEQQIVKYFVDEKNRNELAERTDYCNISGNIVWLDQMIQYASRRKAKIGSFTSFKLDDIGERTAKVKKLDYSHITTSIVKLPYLDFKTFIFYNIMDVIVQKCIEACCQDVDYIFAKALVNNTSYRKVHRQSVYLANRITKDFLKDGYVIGNNINKWNEKPEEKYLGALVGEPLNTNGYSKRKINGTTVMLADNLMDEDYKSLYPSIEGENNIAPNTQVGKIIIPEKVYKNENSYNQEKYSRAGEFIENMVTDNILEFAHRYFNLASYREMLEDFDEYYRLYRTGFNLDKKYGYGLRYDSSIIHSPISFNYHIKSPVKFFPEETPIDHTWIDKIRGGMDR